MAREFILEDPGEGIHEVEILEIHTSVGDEVEDGQTILTVETDKATMEVPSPFSGTVEEIRVEEGEVAHVGDILMTYTSEGAEREESAGAEKKERKDAKGKRKENEQGKETKKRKKDTGGKRESREGDEREAPRGHEEEGPVPASPATRRLAREHGVDLREISGSGPGGRVTSGDVERFAEWEGAVDRRDKREKEAREKKIRRRPLAAAEAPPLPVFTRWGEVERIPLRSVRRTTAERMSVAWSQIPHVMHQDMADITDLERMRREQQEELEQENGRLTLTVLVMKVVAAALKEFPRFNASLDPEAGEIVLKHYCHIGVAVDTERGLIVPVVRDADCKSVTELAAELDELVEKTRRGEVERADLEGGTFTITNPGPLGGTSVTPIINHPQVAILGIGRAELVPVVEGDLEEHRITARLRLPLCLSFDHRVNDGADAARFVSWIAEHLRNPESFVLTV